jgi:hypothetical protein
MGDLVSAITCELTGIKRKDVVLEALNPPWIIGYFMGSLSFPGTENEVYYKYTC